MNDQLSDQMSGALSATSGPLIITRGTKGLHLLGGRAPFGTVRTLAEGNTIKCVDISGDGKHLAFADVANSVRVVSLESGEQVFCETNANVNFVQLSPKANVLLTWRHFTKPQQNNLCLYSVFSGVKVDEMCQKKQSRCAFVWSGDETVCVRHLNMELLFYQNNCFDRYVYKLFAQKVVNYAMATNKQSGVHYVACYSSGVKGQPSFVRVYQYPNFEGLPVANKSFYKADDVDFKWNHKGDALLLVCSTDVDKSGQSYYGQQTLHYLDVTGVTFIVTLKKEGPIHNTEWLPSDKETLFCVIYGFMPSIASLFNNKAEAVFNFGEPAMRNIVAFNPFGSLVALAGFGNLRGGVQVWNVKQRKLVSEFKASDTTHINWCPDGIHIMTATTAPRLRVGNGYRIWHYDSTQLFDCLYDTNSELYDIFWQPSIQFTEPVIKDINITPTIKTKEPDKYVPPHKRTDQKLKQKPDSKSNATTSSNSNLNDAEKKVKNLKKKLEQIDKLKQLQSSGKQLEKNQLEKIEKEDELIEELQRLSI